MDKRNEKSKEAIRQALIRLSRTKPYSEISVRDLVLARYQNYLDTRKEMGYSPEATERMEKIICHTVRRLRKSIPDLSYFLYN